MNRALGSSVRVTRELSKDGERRVAFCMESTEEHREDALRTLIFETGQNAAEGLYDFLPSRLPLIFFRTITRHDRRYTSYIR